MNSRLRARLGMFEFRNMNQELGKNMLELPTWKKTYNKLAGGINKNVLF